MVEKFAKNTEIVLVFVRTDYCTAVKRNHGNLPDDTSHEKPFKEETKVLFTEFIRLVVLRSFSW